MKTKPKLGQNFLTDARAQRLLVDALGPLAFGLVLEIGPGKAAVTHLLAARSARLIAVEIDPALASALRAEFAAMPTIQASTEGVPARESEAVKVAIEGGQAMGDRAAESPAVGSLAVQTRTVEILEADILSLDLSRLVHGQARSLAVLGNLPYYITSPILQHLFAHQQVLSRAVLMVQREVAERITAAPGTSDYGLLTVLCQMHAEVELLFTLPPQAFSPPPEVHSSVVRLEFAPRWHELQVSPEPFTRFLRACFAQKRKTLANNLRAAGLPAEAAAALQTTSPTARAEELSPAELAAVFRRLYPSADESASTKV